MTQAHSVAARVDAAVAPQTYEICLLFPGHLLTDHMPFGDGLVAFGFISELARRGHRLHVIAQRVDMKNPLPANVTIYTVAGQKRNALDRARFIARSRAIVRRLMMSGRLDLVQQLNPVSNGMILGMLGLRLPIVLGTYVGYWPPETSGKETLVDRARNALRESTRLALSRIQEHLASAFLVTTPAALSRFSSASRVQARVHWLPHGIDIRTFAHTPLPAGSEKSILFLSSVTKRKGIFTLLEAFELVHKALPEVKLDIAGNGAHLKEAETYVSSMSAGAQVRFLGLVGRGSVPELMAKASVYCLPSFGEPYATTVIEAMACGRPVVVTRSGGLPDMVSDEGGRRVRPGDAQELAAALIEILSSPALAEQMGAHNRRVAECEYDWPRVGEKLEAVYHGVLSEHTSPAER